MEKENIVKEKSYKFSLRIVKLYKYLLENKSEYILSRQVLRCGTSSRSEYRRSQWGNYKKGFC